MNKTIKYENGLRLIVDYLPSMRSVASGIWVGAGSSKESPENNGISHFTEHMMFKGTDKLSPFAIANAFETVGAMVNAFTAKENTCYYVKAVDEYSEKCFALLCDIYLHSAFPAEELDKERKVIVEEINMVEDSPEDICYDLLASALYEDSPLGQTILGPIDNVKRFTGEDIRAYMAKTYCAPNVVIAMAGNITLQEADRQVQKYLLPYLCTKKSEIPTCPRFASKGRYVKRFKDFEQSNIAISYPSLKFNDRQSTTQAVLNIILGGGMSSRLFQNIREIQGLAYSVYSAPSAFANNGSFNILLNITPKNTERVLVSVKNEIGALVKEGVRQEEFERAKAQLKSACVFAQESVQTVMTSLGKMLLMSDEIYDVNKKIAEIDAVTMDSVTAFARQLFVQKNVCAAYVGKETSVDILQILSEA